jgi:AcrR family transcriptional regulator
MPDTADSDLKQIIVDTAVSLARQRSWEAVRLHEVADAAGISLDDIRRYFPEKDALIDAWFDRADAAALALAASGELITLSVRERLLRLIMAWLQALQSDRRVTRQMVLSRCEPGHLHIQIPALMRISRTVQWIREAALLHDTGLARAGAETMLTAIYLATFVCWLGETAETSPRTRSLLNRLLAGAERLALACRGMATPGQRQPTEFPNKQGMATEP